MQRAPSNTNTAFGRGAVLFARFDANGVKPDRHLHLGNCDEFATSVSVETVEMTDYTQPTSAPYNEATKKTDVGLKISGFEFNTDNLALIMSGDIASVGQTSGSAVAETIAAATETGVLGGFFRTAFRSISSVVVEQGANTLVAGTDYEVFAADSGIIRILPASATVVDGTAITASYSYATITARDVVRAFNTAQIKGSILFRSNNTTGPNWDVEIYNATLAPDGDTSFISDDWLKWNLVGKVLSDAAGSYGGSTNDPFMLVTPR